MGCFRRMKWIIIGAVLAVCLAGIAEAAPYVSAWREVHVNINSQGRTDYSTQKFDHLGVRVSGSELSTPGTITITPSAPVEVQYFKSGTYPPVIFGKGTLTAEPHPFSTFPELSGPNRYRHEALDPEKGRISFIGTAAETGITYSVSYTNGSEPLSDSINTTPPTGCLPYMELTTSGNKLTGVTLRIVANSNSTGTALASGAITNIGDNEIYVLNDKGGFDAVELGFKRNDNSLPDWLEWTNPNLNIDLDKVVTILISFNAGSYLSNGWNFDVHPDLMPKPITIALPTDGEVAAAQTAISSALGDASIAVDGAKEASVSSNQDVKTVRLNEALVSSAIAVSQTVASGGAVIFGKDLELPLNAKSLDGTNIAKADSLEALKNQYSVMKYFPNGGGVDLLTLYGDQLFSYDAGTRMVKFKKTIVVVDRPVPGDAYFKSGSCGVNLVGDYLYVFDGKTDGKAQDPIALQSKAGSGGGGSGCDAGFGVAAGLLLSLACLGRKKI